MAAENGKNRGVPPVSPPPQDGTIPSGMPMDLELDLLVDEELPEEQRRRELLRSLDKAPEHWRDLSIRFLERQVEKKSVRQLITDAALLPPDSAPESPANYLFPGSRWLSPARLTALAAGLLIAIASALLTTYLIENAQNKETRHPLAVADQTDQITTDLPGSVVGMDKTQIPVQLSVRNIPEKTAGMALFPPASADEAGARRSVVIKPDGLDNALVIPVKNLQFQ